ncbi:GNAT family N-acetyltransferase [Parahaliea sp. F7430]|uniref:GNAT family N-acetyltransferase n=1 Tax=Sediminihaliea albiluteola TaxID=2758564 RepID=A0A7W2TYK8_9GAMM|nr:bifunctional acetyl coenzyme A synthetase (ADP forming), alpha domain/GNAT family N-acetyltransferase [Sediminihaliea albiluteola]MBA6414327.1 GNAT family N-acetyltransferase [Sediminihaliea albiluteola]
MRKHNLQRIFEPRSVAVIGASDRSNSVGYHALHNLLEAGFSGSIFPVNRNHKELLGQRCYASIADISSPIDLVVMAIPAASIPEVMQRCVEAQVGGVLVISAGFGEVGPLGKQLQDEIVALARQAGIPLVGPNCLGIIRPKVGLNASFARSAVRDGRVALVSQSGAFCTALLDAAYSGGRGFSAVASLGATADVGFGEVLDYLSFDPQTQSILLYIEGVVDARAFLSGLRAAARLKPVIVIKPGRHAAGRRAAVTHTGGHAGSDEAFNAALDRAGVVRVNTVNQLLAAANSLSSGIRVRGSRLAIITNGGGPGVMAADHATEQDLPLAELQAETLAQLAKVLPQHWSPTNPIDLLGDADSKRYEQSLKIVLQDSEVDGALVLLSPQGMTDPSACAEGVIVAAQQSRKPVLACWMGLDQVAQGRQLLSKAGIPSFNSPEGGVDGFAYIAAHQRNQEKLMQAPPPLSERAQVDLAEARRVLQEVLDQQCTVLDSVQARAVLEAFRIPVSQCINCTSSEQVQDAAQRLGLPVVLKINSPDITYKSEVGGVRLNVHDMTSLPTLYHEMMAAVKARSPQAQIHGITVERMELRPHAREVMVAIERDPVFGPIIRIGTGGTSMDIYTDSKVALPPLNVFLCEDLIQRTQVERALQRHRHLPEADRAALVEVLKRVSEMACELPELERLVINPLLVDERGVIAVDAWIALSATPVSAAPYSHMAIHPYPQGLASTIFTKDSREFTLRPIRPEDALIEQRFVDNLSAESRYFRFMYGMGQISRAMVARFTQIDYDREMALVVVAADGKPEASMKAVARYVASPESGSCEFALAVADEMQRQGLGLQLMQRLIALAQQRGFSEMRGEVLAQNHKMLRLCRRLGFELKRDPLDGELIQLKRSLTLETS